MRAAAAAAVAVHHNLGSDRDRMPVVAVHHNFGLDQDRMPVVVMRHHNYRTILAAVVRVAVAVAAVLRRIVAAVQTVPQLDHRRNDLPVHHSVVLKVGVDHTCTYSAWTSCWVSSGMVTPKLRLHHPRLPRPW